MAPNNPRFLISIECMTYNQASFVEDAMRGFCIQQTKFPFLAIVCDDASTDGEQDVIRNYLGKHFHMSQAYQWKDEEANYVYACHKTNHNCYFLVIFLKTNYFGKKDKKHLWEQWEENVKYKAYCEGDDYWIDILKLQKQKDYLECHPECSYLFTNRKCLINGELTTSYQGRCIYSKKDILSGMIPGIQTVMHRKIENFNKLYSTMVPGVNGDIGFAYVFSTMGELHCMSDVTAVYRYSGYGVFSSLSLKQRYETGIKHYYSFHKGLNFPDNDALLSFYCWQLHTITLGYIRDREWIKLERSIIFALRHCPTIFMRLKLFLRFLLNTIIDLGTVFIKHFHIG